MRTKNFWKKGLSITRFEDFRGRHSFTIKQICMLLRISIASYYNWINGSIIPNRNTQRRMIELIKTPWEKPTFHLLDSEYGSNPKEKMSIASIASVTSALLGGVEYTPDEVVDLVGRLRSGN